MPEQTLILDLSNFYAIGNFIIGTCFISIAFAFLDYLMIYKASSRKWAFAVIFAFFLVAGASRMVKGFAIGPADAPIKVTLDLIAGTLGIPAAIMAWPLLRGLRKLPSREQL